MVADAVKTKKAPNRKPSMRQKKALDEMVENGGNVSQAMIAAGYSPATAQTPQKLTESKTWKVLLEEYLPDELLTQRHTELLNATYIDHAVFPVTMSPEEITQLLKEANCIAKKFMHADTQTHVWFWASDNKARKDALDMAFKLKGSYAAEKQVRIDVKVDATPEDLKLIEQFENERLKQIADPGNPVAGQK